MEDRRQPTVFEQNQNENTRANEDRSRREYDENFNSGANNHLFDSSSGAGYPNQAQSSWSVENARTYGKDQRWQSPEERRYSILERHRYWTRDFNGQPDYGNELVRNSELSHIGKGPKGYQRSDDRIKEDVSEALYRHPAVDASDIEVKVQSGTVTLTGTVEDREMKRMAEDAAEHVMGVTNVLNLLTIHRNGWVSRNPRIS